MSALGALAFRDYIEVVEARLTPAQAPRQACDVLTTVNRKISYEMTMAPAKKKKAYLHCGRS
jgi:hypothetical protein